MELDRTSIVIAQRSIDELFDLSLIVLRTYWHRILPLALIGVLPFVLANFFMLQPLTDFDRLAMTSTDNATAGGHHARYLWTVLCLVYLEAPLAMCGVTYFLGQAVFIEQPTLRQVWQVIRQRFLALVWILGILRGGLLGLAFALWLYLTPTYQPQLEMVLFSAMAMIVFFLIRSFRPFAPEILLLERCPLYSRKNSGGGQSYARRSSWLHTGSGDLFSAQVGFTFLAFVFILAFSMGSLFLMGTLIGNWRWGWWMDRIFFPMILWGLALWETVLRFLMYLNTRIRSEGWEVELRLKAELQRWVEQG